ncbi:hypothetical protein ES708_22916 [subsurface metagenome]
MRKMKLLTAVLFCLGIAGMASAVEVINIDLNAQGNDIAYSDDVAGCSDATNIWRAYSEGWGKAMGSPRSANLVDYNEPNKPGIYAAQVWIGTDMNDCNTYGPPDGNGLMDDGFVKTGGGPNDPNIRLWGVGAYGGIDPNFDIYVYGANDGNFTLTCPIRDPNSETKHVNGWSSAGFVPGENYVVFYDVPIPNEPNHVTISYDNVLNGLQLVKLKDPVVIIGDQTYINATEYDVAYETNLRADESQQFGPDIDGVNDVVNYLDSREYMEYDIEVKDGNEGWYQVKAYVQTELAPASLDLYLVYRGNDIYLGTVTREQTTETTFYPTTTIEFNLFAGSHSIKWVTSSEIYFNLSELLLDKDGDLRNVDCNEVYKYGLKDPMDLYGEGDGDGDCHVDFKDLAVITDPCNWLECYDPNTDNCP